MDDIKILAVIPARGGSKGLVGKNIRPFVGFPLIHHSIFFARMCSEINRCIISTDSPEVRDVCQRVGGDTPFLRPPDLAQDDTPLWPVLRHALKFVEDHGDIRYDFVLLLDPTSPAREPEDLTRAIQKIMRDPKIEGVVSVSKPDFNPIWTCVVEKNGLMESAFPGATSITRRQDVVGDVFRINGALYLWRASFLRREAASWRGHGNHVMMETPEGRSLSIDTLDQFVRAESLVRAGLIVFPWAKQMRECL